jgi:hypothetical protein
MKLVGLFVVVICIAGFIYWDDIFSSGSDSMDPTSEENVVKVKVPDDGPVAASRTREKIPDCNALLAQGKWEDALAMLQEASPQQLDLKALAAKHLCLTRLKEKAESLAVLKEIMDRDKASTWAVNAMAISAEAGNLSLVQTRQGLSSMASGFDALDTASATRLLAVFNKLNQQLPRSMKGLFAADKYVVVPNDCLWNICSEFNRKNKFNLESGLLRVLNGIKGDQIYPGQTLMIPKDQLTIKIWRKNWLMGVFLGSEILYLNPVGLGKDNCTPQGDFVIKTRLKEPDWYSEQHGKLIPYGDPMNILGTRWLGFENREDARGLGIHGTVSEDSIGKNMSSGCIRMRNKDVEELFEIISRGTTVSVM